MPDPDLREAGPWAIETFCKLSSTDPREKIEIVDVTVFYGDVDQPSACRTIFLHKDDPHARR